MDFEAQEDFFDDDDLDDIPDNAYNELERNALLATQQQPPVARHHPPLQPQSRPNFGQQPSSQDDFEFEDDDVIDLGAQHASPGLSQRKAVAQPSFSRSLANAQHSPHTSIPPTFPSQNSRDLQKQGTILRNPPSTSILSPRPLLQNGAPARQLQDVSTPQVRLTPVAGGAQEARIDVASLQARIRELEQERDGLHKSAEDARNAVVSKAGEIAIVRANHDKIAKEYERRLAVMQKLHAEEAAKQKSELDATKKEREKAETNNKFLEHDLAQEAERARNARKSLKDGHGNLSRMGKPGTPMSTPKKNRSLPLRDGFDDDEVMFVSPSKSKEKSKGSTPKAGTKRKRLVNENSPAQPLPLSNTEGLPLANLPNTQADLQSFTPTDLHQEKMRFMKSVLNHRKSFDEERTMEVMTTYYLPSERKKTMSSLLYDKFDVLWSEKSLDECRATLCQELMSLWSRCLEEKLHAPLYDLSELLQFILLVSPSNLSTSCIPRLVPLCLATADIVAVPTAGASKNPTSCAPPSAELKAQVDPIDYLSMLELCALSCATRAEPLTAFWTAMEYDFVLVMLQKAQPLSQITSMLSLLTTSILPSSFGAITTNSPQQRQKHESDTVDRLTVLLFETPEATADEEPYTASEIIHLRLDILVLFKALCSTQHGGSLLATHRLAIGRLVRLLHESVVALYAYTAATHALTTQLVNTSVHILAHLNTCHSDVVDMRARLAAVPGGAHKHLVALSRIAFADGVGIIEQGIDGEAAEAAHKMLDEWLSPEEGEAVVSVFSSAR